MGALRSALLATLLLSAAAQAVQAQAQRPTQACAADLQAFWKDFRAAVLKGDEAAVLAKTRLPFVVKGQLDDEPVYRLGKKGFLKRWPDLLRINPELSHMPSSMRGLVEARTELLPEDCTQTDNAWVGAWVFNRTRDGWRFTRAYRDWD